MWNTVKQNYKMGAPTLFTSSWRSQAWVPKMDILGGDDDSGWNSVQSHSVPQMEKDIQKCTKRQVWEKCEFLEWELILGVDFCIHVPRCRRLALIVRLCSFILRFWFLLSFPELFLYLESSQLPGLIYCDRQNPSPLFFPEKLFCAGGQGGRVLEFQRCISGGQRNTDAFPDMQLLFCPLSEQRLSCFIVSWENYRNVQIGGNGGSQWNMCLCLHPWTPL